MLHTYLSAGNSAIVKIHELVLTHDCLGFVMDYMPGGTLQAFVEARGYLNEDLGGYMFRQILYGLERMHAKLIAHRYCSRTK